MFEFQPHKDIKQETGNLEYTSIQCEFDPPPYEVRGKLYYNKQKLKGKFEADCKESILPTTGERPLIKTLALGYGQHYAVTLTPDNIWLTILRGLTDHIDQDPESVRKHFVDFEGKKTLEVLADGYVRKGDPDSNWEFTFREFSNQIKGYIGKKHSLIVSNFSTTQPIDRLSSEVMLMGAMKNYFEYRVMLCCGFPSVRLEGTPEDWENIRQRVSALSELNLTWWTDHLGPVIDQFIKASKGSPDIDFWRRAYLNAGGGSGPSYVSGWINTLYPYVSQDGKTLRNNYVNWEATILKDRGKDRGRSGNSQEDFPTGMVEVPVILDDNGKEYNMLFYGGLIGCQYEEKRVKPISGWAIRDITEDKK